MQVPEIFFEILIFASKHGPRLLWSSFLQTILRQYTVAEPDNPHEKKHEKVERSCHWKGAGA